MAGQQYQRIFLLSHMRAYSSLIGHILGSHPHINGYYEMHLSYSGMADLDEQLRLYRQSESLKPGSIYLFVNCCIATTRLIHVYWQALTTGYS